MHDDRQLPGDSGSLKSEFLTKFEPPGSQLAFRMSARQDHGRCLIQMLAAKEIEWDRPAIAHSPNARLRLDIAAKFAFPDGTMGAAAFARIGIAAVW